MYYIYYKLKTIKSSNLLEKVRIYGLKKSIYILNIYVQVWNSDGGNILTFYFFIYPYTKRKLNKLIISYFLPI